VCIFYGCVIETLCEDHIIVFLNTADFMTDVNAGWLTGYVIHRGYLAVLTNCEYDHCTTCQSFQLSVDKFYN
jgi:hypothetical protein